MSAEKAKAYWQLMRMDRPIGSFLLFWPMLWSLLLAAEGMPDWDVSTGLYRGRFLDA